MNAHALFLRYSLFAVIATIANLLAQRAVLAVERSGTTLFAAIVAGTFVGLVVKYLLDRRWIFHDTASGLEAHGYRFTLYTMTGVATTAIFWGSEYLFWTIWQNDAMREVGAVLGLAVGYAVKYRLDRHYVFVDGQRRDAASR